MGTAAKLTRENCTITVDFRDEATYFCLIADGKTFLECVMAFILSLGFQLKHKATYCGGGCLTRHSHYVRVRLGGVTIWRIQCTRCKAVFTVLPHFVLRYRSLHPDVARDALLVTHGGLSLELCAVIGHVSPMALYRLVCALGHQSLVTVLTRCGLPLPTYFLVDEKHSRCLTEKVYLEKPLRAVPMSLIPLECVRVYNTPPLERRHAMQRNKATIYVFVTVFFVSLAFLAGYVTAQKTENIEWLGWIAVAKPSTSPDPHIHMKKTYDSLVREDIEVGLREDGVVVWRRVQK